MNDYPTDQELEKLRKWDFKTKQSLYEFKDYLKEVWNHHYGYWEEKKNSLYLATGGWSGNESIIDAITHTMFWIIAWDKSERGGAFTFDLKAIHRIKP